MVDKVKQWIAIAIAVAALVIATVVAMKDGQITPDEATEIKEKAGAVVDAFVNEGAATAAPVEAVKGGE